MHNIISRATVTREHALSVQVVRRAHTRHGMFTKVHWYFDARFTIEAVGTKEAASAPETTGAIATSEREELSSCVSA